MENWKSIIPWGLVMPFLIIVLVEYGLSYGLSFYNQKLDQQIKDLEVKLRQKEENLKGGLETSESFKVFSQAVNIVEILKNLRSLTFVINKFNQLMPKFLVLKSFSYDADKQEIEIAGDLPNWQDYLRFHKYLTSLNVLELKSFPVPRVDKNNLINFSMVIFLKPDFYKQ